MYLVGLDHPDLTNARNKPKTRPKAGLRLGLEVLGFGHRKSRFQVEESSKGHSLGIEPFAFQDRAVGGGFSWIWALGLRRGKAQGPIEEGLGPQPTRQMNRKLLGTFFGDFPGLLGPKAVQLPFFWVFLASQAQKRYFSRAGWLGR